MSIVCRELLHQVGVSFPAAHLQAEAMATLAAAGHTVLGFDVVMPVFSVCHEVAALGMAVDWGGPRAMPGIGPPIWRTAADVTIPPDFLHRPACATPLAALRLLRHRVGTRCVIAGKVFGPWTLAYHLYGIENFLVLTLDDPAEVRRILDRLTTVTVQFARAQVEAGAECLLLGDQATRDLCSPAVYEQFLLPVHQELAQRIEVPVLLHVCGDTSDRTAMIARTGLAGLHWDTKTGDPATVRRLAGPDLVLMGGVSNRSLVQGPPREIAAQARTAAANGTDIVGPECAVPLDAPLAHLQTITAAMGGRVPC